MGLSITLDESAAIVTRPIMEAISNALKPILKPVRSVQRMCMERVFIGSLATREHMVLQAIVSRTFGWSKFIEQIPLSVFENGLRDFGGELRLDEAGFPYFNGLGLDKKTLQRGLDGLLEQGLISRLVCQSSGRDGYAYMPLSAGTLITAVRYHSRLFDTEPMIPMEAFGILVEEVDGHLGTKDDEPASDLERAFRTYIMEG